MPSLLLGQPLASGAQTVISGSIFSGRLEPVGSILLRFISSGGCAYISLSGGGPVLSGNFMTITSGGMALSGGCLSGMLDGMILAPGDTYTIPKLALGNSITGSGTVNIFALCDVAASGIGRLYWEAF